MVAGSWSTRPRPASTDAGFALVVPTSIDVCMATIPVTSRDAGIAHELEVVLAADLVSE